MKYIKLTQGKRVIVDDEDYPDLIKRKWCYNHGYAVGRINGKMTPMHRYLLGLKERLDYCDHINRDKLDNRRENLRKVTPSQNAVNQGITRANSSGYRGIYKKVENRWDVYFRGRYVQRFCYMDEAINKYRELYDQYLGNSKK